MEEKKFSQCQYTFNTGFICGKKISLGDTYCIDHARTVEIKERTKKALSRQYSDEEKVTLLCMVCKNELSVFPVMGSSQLVAPCEHCAAQQNAHPTLGKSADLQAVSEAETLSTSDGVPPSAPARVA